MTHAHHTTPANWALHTLTAWREQRDLCADIEDLQQGLSAALDLIRDRDRRIKSLEDMNLHLTAQIMAAMSGRTVAAERQAIETERSRDHEGDDVDQVSHMEDLPAPVGAR
jgi:hypothetical protein